MQKSCRKPHTNGLQQLSGTPGETRTHYLALRRRTLYPGELRGRIYLGACREFCMHPNILLEIDSSVNQKGDTYDREITRR